MNARVEQCSAVGVKMGKMSLKVTEERRGCYMAIMGKFVTLSHISAAHVRAFLVSNVAAVKWPSPYSFLPLPLSTMGCSEMRLL